MQRAALLALAASLLSGSSLLRAAENSDQNVNGAVVDSSGALTADSSAGAVAAAVVDSYASIDTIYCQYTVQFLATADRQESVPKQHRYARSGTKWRYVEIADAGGVVDEVTRCRDDDFVYSFCLSHRDGKEQWTGVSIQDRAEPEPGGFNPENLIGRNLSNVGRSIPEILGREDVSRSEAKLPDGTIAPRLSAGGVATVRANSTQKYDVAITCDPKHDFLPCEILITEAAENVTWPGWAQKWSVLGYQQALDTKGRRQRWFPASGLLTQGTTGAPGVKIVVEKVRINSTLPETLFKPEFPDGLQFTDATSDHSGRRAIQGRRALEKLEEPVDGPGKK